MELTVKESTLELGRWMLVAPLYAAGSAAGLVLVLSSPLMIELLFDPKHAPEGVGHLFETLYIWIGVGVIAGGYGFLLAVAPATLTGVVKVFIDNVVETPKYRERWIYGVAVPVSTLAWFYYLMVYPNVVSFTESYWGKSVYSMMIVFIGMGAGSCWLMLRRKT